MATMNSKSKSAFTYRKGSINVTPVVVAILASSITWIYTFGTLKGGSFIAFIPSVMLVLLVGSILLVIFYPNRISLSFSLFIIVIPLYLLIRHANDSVDIFTMAVFVMLTLALVLTVVRSISKDDVADHSHNIIHAQWRRLSGILVLMNSMPTIFAAETIFNLMKYDQHFDPEFGIRCVIFYLGFYVMPLSLLMVIYPLSKCVHIGLYNAYASIFLLLVSTMVLIAKGKIHSNVVVDLVIVWIVNVTCVYGIKKCIPGDNENVKGAKGA